ncbi:hypothetical protein IV203_037351 [Nitzschia inconspicua]|uniref:Uncharacterized protein n=1 Tax=Nitzschia inconspicua TaxID=303405 RepID=A0A9K3LLQ7_9STRA|nr:hypothetical protein IV203_037351 [Nitzschia inconspicua]
MAAIIDDLVSIQPQDAPPTTYGDETLHRMVGQVEPWDGKITATCPTLDGFKFQVHDSVVESVSVLTTQSEPLYHLQCRHTATLFQFFVNTTVTSHRIDSCVGQPATVVGLRDLPWEKSHTPNTVSWIDTSTMGLFLIPSLWTVGDVTFGSVLNAELDGRDDQEDGSSIFWEGTFGNDYVNKLVDDGAGEVGCSDDSNSRNQDGSSASRTGNVEMRRDDGTGSGSSSYDEQEPLYETFDEVSLLTEDSDIWEDLDEDITMEGAAVAFAFEQGTVSEQQELSSSRRENFILKKLSKLSAGPLHSKLVGVLGKI